MVQTLAGEKPATYRRDTVPFQEARREAARERWSARVGQWRPMQLQPGETNMV